MTKNKTVQCACLAVRIVLILSIYAAIELSIVLAWQLAGGVASVSGAILAGCASFLAVVGAVIVGALAANDL